MPTFQSDESSITFTGSQNYAGASLTIPSGATVQEFAEVDGSLVWIEPSGQFAIFWAASGWMMADVAVAGAAADAIMQESIVWLDLGAGSASGNNPTSVVANPSGADTGWIPTALDGYVVVSGNNTWSFADNTQQVIAGCDVFNFNDNAEWTRTMLFIAKFGTLGTVDRSWCGYSPSANTNPLWGMKFDDFGPDGFLSIVYGGGVFRSTHVIHGFDNRPMAFFCTASGTKSGTSSLVSGCVYHNVDTFAQNFGTITNVAPAIGSGMIGDMGSVNAGDYDVIGWAVWDKALTTAERQQVIDYYSNERGFDVI